MKTVHILAVAVLIAGSSFAFFLTQAQVPSIKRTDVLRHELGVAEHEIVQLRVDFTPGMSFSRHSHPGAEIAYVLEGTLEYQLDGKPLVILKTGEALFIPAGTIHSAKNIGRGNAVELATYFVAKDKPLIVLAK